MTEAQIRAQLVARFEARRAQFERAIGQQYSVRTSKTLFHKGVITAVEPGDLVPSGRGHALLFKITMECGSAKALKTFQVSRIPV